MYQLGILVDTDGHYANPNLLDRYLMQPSILKAFGWRFALVLTKDWYHNPDDVLARIEKLLQGQEVGEEMTPENDDPDDVTAPVAPQPATVAIPQPALLRAASPPAIKAAPESNPAGTSVRHFEFVGGASQKFWEISVSGNSFTVRFGRIGTAGQSQTKTFADEAKTKREAENLIAEKVKKGYSESKG
jgi:predicted DNA-binding WGR domain protein